MSGTSTSFPRRNIDFCQDQGTSQLDHRQQSGQRQVEHLQGLDIDFNFQGGEPWASQQQHHAKTAEIEQEHQQDRRQQRRLKQRQGHRPEGAPGRGSQNARRLIQLLVELAPGRADQADDHGGVVKDVGQQDRRQGVHHLQGRL